MDDHQLDLFSSAGIRPEGPRRETPPPRIEIRQTTEMRDDRALIAAIPESNLADSIALASMPPDEFNEFFEAAMAFLAERCGFDPLLEFSEGAAA